MFMENVLDPAHVVVSHHNIVGNRYNDPSYVGAKKVKSSSEIPYEEKGDFNPLYPEDIGFKHEVLRVSNSYLCIKKFSMNYFSFITIDSTFFVLVIARSCGTRMININFCIYC